MGSKTFKAAAAAVSAILLAACGGGGGGGSSLIDPPDTPLPLTTKADGLRALGLTLGGPLSSYAELPIDVGMARAKSRGHSWTRKPSAKAIVEDCDSGNYRYEDGTKNRDFDLLSPAAKGISVYFEKGTNNNCKYSYEEDGMRYVSLETGAKENGASEVLQSGKYEYFLTGSERAPVGELYQEFFNNQLVYEERTETYGTLERVLEQSQLRYGLRYTERFGLLQDGVQVALAWDLGRGNTPLRASVGRNGDWFKLAGSYAFGGSVESCKGGQVDLSTPSVGGVAVAGGQAVGGQLKIQAGTNAALYSFNNDGGATLTINGGTGISVSADEVRNAVLNIQYCDF